MATLVGTKRKLVDRSISSTHLKRTKVDADQYSHDGSDYNDGNTSLDDDDDLAPRSVSRASTQPSTQPSTPDSLIHASSNLPSAIGPSREKKFLCDFPGCGKAYARPVRLAEHQRSHTNERPFVCTHQGCDKSFLRESHLKHHVKAKHQDLRDYPCDHPGCDKAFHTASRLKEHKKIHDRLKDDFTCTDYPPCNQEFRKQDTLDRHIRLVHFQEKPFICDQINPTTASVCGARFKTSTHLIGHKDREHSGNRFWCNICSPEMTELDPRLNPAVFATAVGFPSYVEMQQHVKTMHPPTCDQCGEVCASNRHLKAHVDIHHGSIDERRNYVCDHPGCGRGFTKKGNLQVHKSNVHAKQKQFVCGEFDIKPCKRVPEWDGRGACRRPFGTKASLEEHVRTQHLHLPRSVRKSKSLKEESVASVDTTMADPHSTTLTMLTGVGYDTARNIACPVNHCHHRMQRVYDLEVHLRAAHFFEPTEVIEAVKEQEALTGGDFWYGGADGDLADIQLAQALQALDPALHEPMNLSGY